MPQAVGDFFPGVPSEDVAFLVYNDGVLNTASLDGPLNGLVLLGPRRIEILAGLIAHLTFPLA